MKLPSSQELVILSLLRDHGECYGLQILENAGGRLSRGGVYVVLDRMETKGLVDSRKEAPPDREGGLPRRLYKITGLGARSLEAAEQAARHIGAPLSWRVA